MKSKPKSKTDTYPSEPKLKKSLGDVYTAYQELLTLTEGFDQAWKYYGRKIGWQLKISRKGKALLYLTPLEGSFRVGLTVREDERQKLLNSTLPADTKTDLRSAKKYPEGYPLRLGITDRGDMRTLRVVFEVLKELR